MTDAKQVPLHELLLSVPANARLVIDYVDGKGMRYIPVGRYCHEAAVILSAAPQQQAETLKCGHHASLAVVSAETGEFLYCDLCDCKSARRDAEKMEENLRAELAALKAQQAEPVAYLCPAGCGCTWRDNRDGSMSLFGHNSRSCATCENLPLSGLIPVYYPPLPTPRITATQVEQIKRLADELVDAATDLAMAEASVLGDPSVRYKREELKDATAALHAALDALKGTP